jgi:hypothetical protein
MVVLLVLIVRTSFHETCLDTAHSVGDSRLASIVEHVALDFTGTEPGETSTSNYGWDFELCLLYLRRCVHTPGTLISPSYVSLKLQTLHM